MATETAKHTLTPWRWAYGADTIVVMRNTGGTKIAEMEFCTADNADHIVRAVNAYDDMLAALYGTLGIVELVNAETPGAFNDDLPDLIAEARAAIAKAKGE